LLHQDTQVKRGVRTKRLRFALDTNYVLHVLKNAIFDA
jgi:hypothetical protein